MVEAAALLIAGALLAQGRRLHEVSLMLTLAGLVAAVIAGPTVPVIVLALAMLVAACLEIWLAVRVGLDATLFRHLAAGNLDLRGVDLGLQRVGLTHEPAMPRDIDSRIAGAKRLLMRQAGVVAVQLAIVVALVVTAWSHR